MSTRSRAARPGAPRTVGRRAFLTDLGRGTLGVLVLGVGIAACGDGDAEPSTGTTGTGADDPGASPGTMTTPETTTTGTATTGTEDPTTGTAADGTATVGDELAWERVSLGFVSAYVLVRGGEAAVVDTGVEGSEGAIGTGLEAAGVGWADVGHVVLTHHHPDHVGSAPAVLELATEATAYAGAEDIPSIPGDLDLTAVADGDSVFDLDIVATPGHTPGHVCVHDPATGLLVAGDAVVTDGGALAGPPAEFTADPETALESIRTLAGLDLRTILVGHGDPATGDDLAAQLEALAAG